MCKLQTIRDQWVNADKINGHMIRTKPNKANMWIDTHTHTHILLQLLARNEWHLLDDPRRCEIPRRMALFVTLIHSREKCVCMFTLEGCEWPILRLRSTFAVIEFNVNSYIEWAWKGFWVWSKYFEWVWYWEQMCIFHSSQFCVSDPDLNFGDIKSKTYLTGQPISLSPAFRWSNSYH